MILPSGPWTAEVMHQVVDAKVEEIRAGLNERIRRVNGAETVQRVDVAAQEAQRAGTIPQAMDKDS